jgi:hypothetical protein
VFTSDLPQGIPDVTVRADSAIAGALADTGAILLWRAGEQMLFALLVTPLIFSYAAFTVADFFIEPRFGSFLLFHTLVLAACGVGGLLAALPPGWGRSAAVAAAALIAGLAILHSVRASDALHELPRENFKQAARLAREVGARRVFTDSTRPQGLQWYLGVDAVAQRPNEELERDFCTTRDAIVYIEHPYRGAGEGPPPDLSCLRRRGAEMARVHQRDRGGRIDVWSLTP